MREFKFQAWDKADEIDDIYIRVLENLKIKLMKAYKESVKNEK